MRKFLNALYDGAAALAALFMVLMLIMVLLSIVGRELGFYVRGTDAYAGYFMAAAGFLALAHTLKKGEHIRVTLLITKLKGFPQKAMEVWSLFAASALACIAAFYAAFHGDWHDHLGDCFHRRTRDGDSRQARSSHFL
jgi:TRAP-type C4-dicarboxylate transport system permease small subunit